MVVITYFYLLMRYPTEKNWAILGSSGAFLSHFWVILGHLEGFLGTVRFSHYSSRMVVITYFFSAVGFPTEKFWAILGRSGAFLGHFWEIFGYFELVGS